MKLFYPKGSDFFLDDNVAGQLLADWFDKDESDVNHKLWLSESPDLDPVCDFGLMY